ncbi:MAG TPA: hypothetical protein VN752_03800 [Solirubrobacterales bacterium]|nr:hypothetical protein [Solirubrobacterales bacterium]
MVQSKALRPDWLPAVALSSLLAAAMLAWNPQVGDLAAQVFRAELFQQAGLAIWNGSWYGGHYTLTYSFLFPPLAAMLGPQLVGTVSVIASSYLFDRLVRDRWGEASRWATLWFAAGVVTLLADGQLTFALGVAFGLASLRALQTSRIKLALLGAAACALSSPVAAVFLAGVLIAGTGSAVDWIGLSRGWRGLGGAENGGPAPARRPPRGRGRTRGRALSADDRISTPALWTASIALALILVPNVLFPSAGQFPFAFSSFIAIPLWCGSALFVTRQLRGEERQLRWAIVAYLLVSIVIWLVPNPMGGNSVRLGALFGGPVLAAVVLARRPRVAPWFLALFMAGGLYWQVTASVSQIARSVGDPSTSREYFQPAAEWLRENAGPGVRVEVPPTANHWESAYLASQVDLARGWLRQLDTTRDDIFYGDEELLNHASYRHWLRSNAISYVALPDAPPDYSSVGESRLIRSGSPYLDLRWSSAHWRIYAVRDPEPLVEPIGPAAAQLLWVGRQGLALQVQQPGDFLVRVNFTPYWSIARGSGCIIRRGEWTVARAAHPGVFRVAADFSVGRAWNAVTGARKTC